MKNIFTIDTEDWFHANYEDNLFANNSEIVSTVERNIDRYLELFEQYNVKATFFVLGFITKNHPQMVKNIAKCGHEIASHGYGHQLVYKQSKDEFRQDIKKSKTILEDLLGRPVYGYRAPSWSIIEESLWALDILEDEGFLYSSSIFPTHNHLYGIPYAPRFIHTHEVYGKSYLKLKQIPPSTSYFLKKKINIPFSGGAYLRLLPYKIIKFLTDRINNDEKQPVVFYLHPREIDMKQPHLKLKLKDSLIHYYGIKSCEYKLTQILNEYKFETMSDFLGINYVQGM